MKKLKETFFKIQTSILAIRDSHSCLMLTAATIGMLAGGYFFNWFCSVLCWDNTAPLVPFLVGVLWPICFGCWVVNQTYSWWSLVTIPFFSFICQILWVFIGGLVGVLLSLGSDPFPLILALFFYGLCSAPIVGVIIFII